jgi:hypothetical protein
MQISADNAAIAVIVPEAARNPTGGVFLPQRLDILPAHIDAASDLRDRGELIDLGEVVPHRLVSCLKAGVNIFETAADRV